MRTLYWTPRILAIIFIIFMSMFAFDTGSFLGTLIHLIPSFALIVITAMAWKQPFHGGIVFLVLAGVFTVFFKLYKDPISFLIIGLPVVITGILFILGKDI